MVNYVLATVHNSLPIFFLCGSIPAVTKLLLLFALYFYKENCGELVLLFLPHKMTITCKFSREILMIRFLYFLQLCFLPRTVLIVTFGVHREVKFPADGEENVFCYFFHFLRRSSLRCLGRFSVEMIIMGRK